MTIIPDGAARIVISVNSSWNIVNFRAGLVASLRAAGHEVVALAPPDEYTSRLRAMGCRFAPIAIDAKGTSPVTDAALLAAYVRRLIEIRPDVYLGYTIKPNIYGSLAAHSLGVPVVNNVSGLGATFIGDNALRRIVGLLYRIALARSRRVFFQNDDDRKLFVERGIVKPEQTGLLPGSGVDLAKFRPDVVRPAPHAGEFRFLFIGRLLWDKGVGEYVEAARKLKAEGRRIVCAILGFVDVGNPAAIGQARIDAWVAEGIVQYLGATDDVRPHIAAADCVVLPSYREGTPRTLLEAAAMARPLIATDAPGCREAVEHGVNGLLCRIRDADDLAARMREVLSLSPEASGRMGRAGRAKMEREFDERIVIERYREAIVAALSHSSSRR